MLSVIIPTEGAEQPAVATLAALVPGAAARPDPRSAAGRPRRHGCHRARRRCRRLPVPAVRGIARRGAGGRCPPRPLAMADVSACRRGARLRLDRRNRAIHPAGFRQRPPARRHLPLRPLALRRCELARRVQIPGPDDGRPVGGPGIADRAGTITTGSAVTCRTFAAPRRGCCGGSAARRAPCCAAGSSLREAPATLLAKVK